MTYIQALNFAISHVSDTEVIEKLTALRDRAIKLKNYQDNQRKEKAAARLDYVNNVIPILRKYLTNDMTAKQLYESAKAELPDDLSAPKVQNILLHEMAPELIKTENKGKANTYRLAGE